MKQKRGHCRTCSCQVLGAIRPECLRGVTGWLDAQGVRHFDPLPCAFDVTRVLDAPPCHHKHGRGRYEHPGLYSHDKRCSDCGSPISNNSGGRCRTCSSKINGAKRKGGPPNEAWRVSMSPSRRARQA
jgi:ferredoxin